MIPRFTFPKLVSLRARMTLLFTAWFTLIATLACGFFVVWSHRVATDDMQERVSSAIQLVAREWNSDSPKKSAETAIDEAKEDMRLDNVALFILDKTGGVLGSNRGPTLTLADLRQRGWLIREVHSQDAIIAGAMDVHTTDTVIQRQTVLLSLFALLVSGTGGFAAWFLVGNTLRPIGVLAEEANFASSDPLRARLRVPSEDAEVRHLVETLNGFLERFQESTRTREQFYAAAAHELRTPLTVLSGSIELALSRSRSASDYVETLLDLQRETKRLIALAEGLLTLNRLQTVVDAEEETYVNIPEEGERIISGLLPTVSKRDLRLTTDWGTETVEILEPRSHVVMMLRNLIENAVKYAPERGKIQIQARQEQRWVIVSVGNDYDQVGTLSVERIYEPFFRADPSRSLETGGNGLGLAICRRLAVAHGWSLQHRVTDAGIVAEVGFPVADG